MKVKNNFYLTFRQYCTLLFYLRYLFTVLYNRIITKDPQTERLPECRGIICLFYVASDRYRNSQRRALVQKIVAKPEGQIWAAKSFFIRKREV